MLDFFIFVFFILFSLQIIFQRSILVFDECLPLLSVLQTLFLVLASTVTWSRHFACPSHWTYWCRIMLVLVCVTTFLPTRRIIHGNNISHILRTTLILAMCVALSKPFPVATKLLFLWSWPWSRDPFAPGRDIEIHKLLLSAFPVETALDEQKTNKTA